MKRVILNIDSLVFKGYRHEDKHRIAEGLQQELTRLFADPQSAQQLAAMGDLSRLRIARVSIGQGTKPQRVGIATARGIGKEIIK